MNLLPGSVPPWSIQPVGKREAREPRHPVDSHPFIHPFTNTLTLRCSNPRGRSEN